MLVNLIPQSWIRHSKYFLKTNLKQNPTVASLMASVQSVFSTPPFIGLLAPFGSSQDRYLIERRQRTLAASRVNVICCSVGACLDIGAGLQGMKAAWLGLVPDTQTLCAVP